LVRNAIIPKYQLFGWPLPMPEELRHKRQVSEEIDKIEQEPAALGDTAFLNREALREMAEDRLRRDRRGGAQSGLTTAPNGAAVD